MKAKTDEQDEKGQPARPWLTTVTGALLTAAGTVHTQVIIELSQHEIGEAKAVLKVTNGESCDVELLMAEAINDYIQACNDIVNLRGMARKHICMVAAPHEAFKYTTSNKHSISDILKRNEEEVTCQPTREE